MHKEKRKSARKAADAMVELQLGGSLTLQGKLINITRDGALLQAQQVPSATAGSIALVHADGSRGPGFPIRICWMDKGADGVLIGVEFLSPADAFLDEHARLTA